MLREASGEMGREVRENACARVKLSPEKEVAKLP